MGKSGSASTYGTSIDTINYKSSIDVDRTRCQNQWVHLGTIYITCTTRLVLFTKTSFALPLETSQIGIAFNTCLAQGPHE